MNSYEDMQKSYQASLNSAMNPNMAMNSNMAMKMMGEWQKSWQAIAAEMTDYTKRSFEAGTSTMEKLMAAKSVEQAVEIQTSYAKRAYEDYMHQMSKIGSMYSGLAKEAYKPAEKMLQTTR